MDNYITSLEELTQALLHRLDQTSYEELEQFVEQRQGLVDEIRRIAETQPYTDDQRSRLETLLQADSSILGRMEELRDEAGQWLKNRGQAKIQRNVYETSYTPDSILMDKRN